jgi:two-component system sensor histidine kinase BaeS
VAAAVLVASLLAAIALQPAVARPLAVLALVAVMAAVALAWAPVAHALGPLAPALALTLETAAATAAVALTGGLDGPLLALPPILVALARLVGGAPASRFAGVAATLGLVVLIFTGTAPDPRTGARALLPLAVLLVLEIGQAAARVPEAAPSAGAVAASAPRPTAEAAPPARDLKAEILHDLRSPLSAIRVYADLIAERVKKGEPPVDEHVRNLGSEVELMEMLVEARASAPARSVDLVRMLRDLVATYRTADGDRHRLEFAEDVPRAPVAADVVTLQRIFRNVLDNALQYTPPDGQVTVRVSTVGPNALVRIRDTGVGMTAEERGRAFELAYRGAGARAARGGGSGIGLAVARDLVLAKGGDIALESEAGRGSEVRIMFPLAVEERA